MIDEEMLAAIGGVVKKRSRGALFKNIFQAMSGLALIPRFQVQDHRKGLTSPSFRKEIVMNSHHSNLPLKLFSVALAVGLICAALLPSAQADGVETSFSQAMAQCRQGHWSAAYGRFASLADQGDVEAARIALLMLRYGPQMYGVQWSASQPQIELWSQLASQPMDGLTSESGD